VAQESVRLSKFLALVLRHKAAAFGLAPDAEGFVPLAALVAIVEREFGGRAGLADIQRLVDEGQPRRYEIRGDQIRASYGHSLPASAPVAYPPATPPATLYHGTPARALAAIRRDGLRAMSRQYVHLSTTVERARDVGSRRAGEPIILRVRAEAAAAVGIPFYSPEPKHFLTPAIPPEFIEFPTEAS
jgi:putative RNA 2'-phosphotransferase